MHGLDPLHSMLEPDELVEIEARARSQRIVVTNHRIAIADESRVALHVPFESLRRIQFDIERDRPATLVIVPEHPSDEPQVLAIQPEHYEEVALALAAIGRRLAS
jgi:hypothetical protein